MKKIIISFALFSLAQLSVVQSTWAYGALGHKTVAALAWQQLTPFAKQNVERILGEGQSAFVNASTWADEIKSDDRFNYLKPLHYVNLPKNSKTYVASRDCKKDRCIVEAIKDFSQILKTGSEKKKRLALRMVIHLIGDIHQPLHAGLKEDRGGNWYEVKYKRKTTTLHKAWDHQLVKRQGKNWQAVSGKLKDYEITNKALNPVTWAQDSHAIAVGSLYQVVEGEKMDAEYLAMADEITQQQLAHAGWRLGMWLNQLW